MLIDPAAIFSAPTGKFADWLSQTLGSWSLHVWSPVAVQSTHTVFSVVLEGIGWLSVVLAVLIVTNWGILQLLNSASNHEWLKLQSGAMYGLRVLVAIMLMFPFYTPSSGAIPIGSRLVTGLVVAGSNIADMTWKGVVDYLLSPPNIQQPITNSLSTSKQTLQNLVCALAVKSEHSEQPIATLINENKSKSSVNSLSALKNLSNINEIDWSGGGCGKTVLYAPISSSDDNVAKQKFITRLEKLSVQYSREAYQGLLAQLIPIAQTIQSMGGMTLSKIRPDATNADNENFRILINLGNGFASAASQYQSFLNSVPDKIKQSNIDKEVSDQMKKAGWASAGLWYLDLSDYQMIFNQVINGVTIINNIPPQCSFWSLSSSQYQCISKNDSININDGVHAVYNGALTFSKIHAGLISKAQSNIESDCSMTSCSFNGVSKSISVLLTQYFFEQLASWGAPNSEKGTHSIIGSINPIWALSNLGRGYVHLASAVYGFKLFLIVLSGAGKGFSSSLAGKLIGLGSLGAMSTVISVIVAIISEITKFLGHIIDGMLVNGFFLGYIVPFWPTLIWTFLIIGYLAIIMEAMLLAPIALAVALFPSGETVQGLNMMRFAAICIGVFIRPFLYIAGFVIVFLLSYVGFNILNWFFWRFVHNYDSAGPYVILSIITIYTFICVFFVQWVFSLLTRIPENGVRVLTGGIIPTVNVGDPTHRIESETMSAAKSLSSMSDTSATRKNVERIHEQQGKDGEK